MKPQLVTAILALGATTAFAAPYNNTSPRHAKRLYFSRGTHNLAVVDHIRGTQHRYYVVKIRAGQRLRIAAQSTAKNPDRALVPIIKVTPPRGEYDGDKTAIYKTNSSRAGDYKIEVAPNLMASNSNSGDFLLTVNAR